MLHDRYDLVLIVAADHGIGVRHGRIIIVVALVLYKEKKTEPLKKLTVVTWKIFRLGVMV